MKPKYWIGIAMVVCMIEVWVAYVGYIVLGKPDSRDGYYIVIASTIITTFIGFWGVAAWDD